MQRSSVKGEIPDSFFSLEGLSLTIANVSVNKTIEVTEGTIIQYQWFANDSVGNMGSSSIFNVITAGFTAPNETIHTNNFFNSNNKTIISLAESSAALLNLSFEDNIELFGFEIRIRDENDILIFNLSNSSLTGTLDNFTRIINILSHQGFFTVNITVSDTHTAKFIPDYKIDKGLQNYLRFNDNIKITTEGAIYSGTKKRFDRYEFHFNYIPFFAPKNKVFYIESNGKLEYRKESSYKGHFVDWKNKQWIDFEGIEGKPIITKINDYKWKIEFYNTNSKVIFNSIGGLNLNSNFYEYYLANTSVKFFIPSSNKVNSISDSIQLSLNVTGNTRNKTIFRLFNSSKNLIDTFNISNNGTGTFFYNHTFTSLPNTIHFINATNVDITGQHINSTTITFNKIEITDCTVGFPAINFTIIDEQNGSLVNGTAEIVFNFNGTNPTETFTRSVTLKQKFSTCIFPPEESLTSSFTATYSAPLYQERVLTVDSTILSNITQLRNLTLLQSANGIFATFKLIDSFSNPLSDVTGTMKLSSGEIIEIRNTDDGGTVTFFVDPDVTYTFTFTITGFKTNTFSLRITTTDIITVTMESEEEALQASIYTGIDYFFEPSNTILNNNTDINFVFNMTSSFWNITGCVLRLKNTTTILSSSAATFNGSQCIIPITLNTGNQTLIISEATYELNSTFNNTVSVQYSVIPTSQGPFSLKTFIDDINSFVSAGFDNFARFLLAIFIIIAIVGWGSLELSALRGEEEILVGLTIALVFVFSYIGWLNIPLETFPNIRGLPENWLNQWMMFVLTLLGGGSFILRKKL